MNENWNNKINIWRRRTLKHKKIERTKANKNKTLRKQREKIPDDDSGLCFSHNKALKHTKSPIPGIWWFGFSINTLAHSLSLSCSGFIFFLIPRCPYFLFYGFTVFSHILTYYTQFLGTNATVWCVHTILDDITKTKAIGYAMKFLLCKSARVLSFFINMCGPKINVHA